MMVKTMEAIDGVDCQRFRRQMTGGVPLPSRTESCKLMSTSSPRLAVVLLLLLSVVMTTAGQIMNNEHSCLSQGGLCAVKESCPIENHVVLCQQENSVCCRGEGQSLDNEPGCRSQGGLCAVKESCPMQNRITLCQQENAVCCQGVPNNVSSCHAHGGNCEVTNACENVHDFGTLDCKDGQRCCLLIY